MAHIHTWQQKRTDLVLLDQLPPLLDVECGVFVFFRYRLLQGGEDRSKRAKRFCFLTSYLYAIHSSPQSQHSPVFYLCTSSLSQLCYSHTYSHLCPCLPGLSLQRPQQ